MADQLTTRPRTLGKPLQKGALAASRASSTTTFAGATVVVHASPIGALTLVATPNALIGIYFERHVHAPAQLDRLPRAETPLLREARSQLDAWFAGRRRDFALPLEGRGTQFQRNVWRALTEIPFGETRSYAELADSLGSPLAVRAVGAANGRNPLSIVVPCHRVIGSSGAPTGYAGGLDAKRWLLAHEAKLRR